MGQLIHTFTVEDTEEIIPRVKNDFGEKALIITNKQIRPKTMHRKGIYEVMVAIEESDYEEHLRSRGLASKSAAGTTVAGGVAGGREGAGAAGARLSGTATSAGRAGARGLDEDVILDFSRGGNLAGGGAGGAGGANFAGAGGGTREAGRGGVNLAGGGADGAGGAGGGRAGADFPASRINPHGDLANIKDKLAAVGAELSKATNTPPPEPSPAAQTAKKMENFEKQISQLSDKMNLLVDMIWEGQGERQILIPPEFASIYKLAKESGMLEAHLNAIMQATVENMPPAMKANPEAITRYFYSLLRNILPCRVETPPQQQKIMMMTGPTGVGKTTTLAKLAFRYAYGDRRYKTGIITLDTYRIGAVEQLFQYAKMMKLPIIDSIEPSDLDGAIKSLSNCEIILVDTIGNSQYDQAKLAKTKEFLAQSNAEIDVSLIVSANTKYDDLMEIYRNFSFLGLDTLIVTKFDETKAFGNIFSLIYETNIPLSFFSTGQEVPDDLRVASSDFLVSCILEGFSREGGGE